MPLGGLGPMPSMGDPVEGCLMCDTRCGDPGEEPTAAWGEEEEEEEEEGGCCCCCCTHSYTPSPTW